MLRKHLLPALRAGAASLHQRFLFGSVTATRPARFVAEDYLIASCGLTLAQARRASKHLARLKSPDNPDAVRAFLAGIGVSQAHATAAIARHPLLLASKVDKTLTPRAAQLQQMGLSASEISRLVSIIPSIFVRPTEISRLPFYLSLLGSYENVLDALSRTRYLLSSDIDNVVKPNVEFLLQCGLAPCDVASVGMRAGLLFTMALERVKEVVARADNLGVPRSSSMYKKALEVANQHGADAIDAKMDVLKKALGCSESEIGIAVCKMPALLTASVGKLGRMVEFLKVDVGLEARYIVRRPQLFNHSLETRLIPRHYVIKVLKAKGILKEDVDFYNVACASPKRFAKRFLDSHKKSIPWLEETYAAACAGIELRKTSALLCSSPRQRPNEAVLGFMCLLHLSRLSHSSRIELKINMDQNEGLLSSPRGY